jgi:proteic killer suppression protein
LIEDDDRSGIQPDLVDKLRRMLAFLQDMRDEKQLREFASWKAHQLTGNRKGMWGLFVSKNGRLTFGIGKTEIEIIDLNHEDYH